MLMIIGNLDTVYKVELSGNNHVFSWRVDSSPHGLSVSTACNLLVACFGAYKIQEYTVSGSLIREILLKSNDAMFRPIHAIQVASDQFVVSCLNVTNKVDDVIEVDTKGRVVVSYINHLKTTTEQKFNVPRRLSVDKNDCIIVTDTWKNRILTLNRSSNCCARELSVKSVDGGLQQPSCLYFDVPHNRLFVGESLGHCRILMFDNVV